MRPIETDNLKKISAFIFDLDRTVCVDDTFKFYLRLRLVRDVRQFMKVVPITYWVFLCFVLRQITNNELKTRTLKLICRGITRQEAIQDQDILIRHLKWDKQILEAIKCCRKKGILTVLATATPAIYTRAIQYKFGFDYLISTEMEQNKNNDWTGLQISKNCYGNQKARRVKKLSRDLNIPLSQIAFVSDSHADLPTFVLSGVSFTVRPTQALQRSSHFSKIYNLDSLSEFLSL